MSYATVVDDIVGTDDYVKCCPGIAIIVECNADHFFTHFHHHLIFLHRIILYYCTSPFIIAILKHILDRTPKYPHKH